MGNTQGLLLKSKMEGGRFNRPSLLLSPSSAYLTRLLATSAFNKIVLDPLQWNRSYASIVGYRIRVCKSNGGRAEDRRLATEELLGKLTHCFPHASTGHDS